MQATGFSGYQRTDVVLDTNAALTLDASLEVGGVAQTVSVSDNTLHVETTSTQLGQVITGRQMTAVPLDGRSYTDLLSLQPGVAPQTSITSTTVQDVGATVLNPSGTLNPGTISVNGQREFANYFSVNGADVEEDVNAGTAIIPNLDAIDEFRIITSNFDAEYGEFSGGQINVITKSGSNAIPWQRLRISCAIPIWTRAITFLPPAAPSARTSLAEPSAARFAATRSSSSPTIRERGRRRASIPAPSPCPRTRIAPGNLVRPLPSNLTGVVGGPYFANLLTQKLGYGVTPGESYYVPGCVNSTPVRLSQRCDSAERLVGAGTAHAAVHPRSQYRQRLCHLLLQPDGARRQGRGPHRCEYSTWACSPATTSSTTSISTIRIRWRRAAPAFPASMPSPPAGRSSSLWAIPRPSMPPWSTNSTSATCATTPISASPWAVAA